MSASQAEEAGSIPVARSAIRTEPCEFHQSATTCRYGFDLQIGTYLRGGAMRKMERSMHLFHSPIGPDGVPDEFLRIGLEFPNGNKATNLEVPWNRNASSPDPQCGIQSGSGGGSGSSYVSNYWVWPLPEDGILKLVVAWPVFEIEETVSELSATDLNLAGNLAVPVWQDDEQKPSHIPWDFWNNRD